MDIGWGEFDRITTRGLGEVREMLRMKSRNDYIKFNNRERPHGMMWLKFKSC